MSFPLAARKFVRPLLQVGGRKEAEMGGAIDWVVIFLSNSYEEALLHNAMVFENGALGGS